MIEINELRIYNWVNYNGGQNKVCAIESPRPHKEEYWNGKWVIEINPPDVFNVPLNELTPIPITEEWLDRLGFYKKGGSWGFYDGEKFITEGYFWEHGELGFWGGFEFDIINGVGDFYISVVTEKGSEEHPFSHEIKYVHQLQNTFFSLTGKEL